MYVYYYSSYYKKEDLLELTGKIEEVLPNSTFRVKVDNMSQFVLCYMGGRLKQNKSCQ